MACLLPHCLILHIPKTGSDWVRAACYEAVEGPITEIGDWHCDLQTAKQIMLDKGLEIPLIGTFVRNPLDWYRSAWLYWKETERFPRQEDEPKVESEDFERFVRNCMAVEPQGYLSTLYERFTGTMPGEVSVIGKQENLVNDLVRLLKLAGEVFDERKLRTVKAQNVGGFKTDIAFPGYTYDLAREVIQFESRAIERYGYVS
ncbi:hypothetical protein [Gimesia fumaroli]|uniref:Sulfotransferase family protein n=1 Tax=Gimesia fumaroli TaxID=2527976 RepID=A0A518I5X0_9PLAN|nr:hypothetical protein [Gimesia fumaroli]QDV48449.1 hypothetical protein Enr17x_04610 [Gimesia fumaroli]